MATDALGYEIAIGQHYGYATAYGGHHRVTIGIATGLTKGGKVRISPTTIKTYLYGEPSSPYPPSDKPTSVSSFILFPVNY
jgi:hypothetical protein